MKKLLILLSAAALILGAASCSKEQQNASGEKTVEVAINLSQNIGIGTKAISDGTTATVLHYAIYPTGKSEPVVLVNDAEIHLETTVRVLLVSGKTYDFIFWADAPDSPYTFDVANKKIVATYNGNCNEENRDAFYFSKTERAQDGLTLNATLSRPFAQINLGTTDYTLAQEMGFDATTATVSVTVDAYKEFDLMTGDVIGTVEPVTFAPTPFMGGTFVITPADPAATPIECEYLAMNYILMAADKQTVNFSYTLHDNEGTDNTVNIVNVPVRRNFRTNLYGNLITNEFDINVKIIPTYIEDPTHEFDVVVERP